MKSEIYWLTRLDYLQGFFIGLGALSALLVIGYIFYYFREHDYENLVYKKGLVKGFAILSIVSILISCFIPTKNEAMLIIAGDAAYQYVEKDSSLQKIPFKTTELLKEVLDKQIQEIKESK